MSRPEPDPIALQSWHYPTNSPVQDDQLCIVESCLDRNSLIVNNDGVTRSFIGHMIMYNYGRWFPDTAKFVFMLLNKNRLSTAMGLFLAHAECRNDELVELSGSMIPSMRETLWRNSRFFFVTPQVLYSDLINGCCPANQIVLLVIDDANLAVGRHAYCEVLQLLQKSRENQNFRVIGLSPMVFSSLSKVSTVVHTLKISNIQFGPDNTSDAPSTGICKCVIEPTELFSRISAILHNEIIGSQIQMLMSLIPTWEVNVGNFDLVQLEKLRQCYLVDFSVCKSQGDVESCFDVLEALLQIEKTLMTIGIEAMGNSLTLLNGPIKESVKAKLRGELERSSSCRRLKELIQSERYKTGFCSNSKLAWLENQLVDRLLVAPEDRIIVVSEHQENSIQLLSALRKHSPTIKPMHALPKPTAKQQSEGFKNFLNGGYNVFITSSVDEEGIEACKATMVFFLEVPQQYSASIMMITKRVVYAVYKGDEEKRLDSYEENRVQMERILSNPEKSIELYRNHWSILPAPPLCIKRMFSVQQAGKNLEPKKRKPAAEKSIAGFEKVTEEMISASPDLSLRLPSSTGSCFLVRHSRRIEDLDLILKCFDQNTLESTTSDNQQLFRLEVFMSNWRTHIDPEELKQFLEQSRDILCGDEFVMNKNAAAPPVDMTCAIDELPDAFFDEPIDIGTSPREIVPAVGKPEMQRPSIQAPGYNEQVKSWQSPANIAPHVQESACSSVDASPLLFHGRNNTRVYYSSVKTTQVDPTPGNARKVFLDTQAGISGSDISDSEQNLSTVGSFICSDETEDDNSPDSQMLGFYRQSLFQSQPWAGFKKGAAAYGNEPVKKKTKNAPMAVVEISESSSDDFLDGSDLDWDAIENNIL